MNHIINTINNLRIVKDTRGQDFIEYALLTGLIAVAAVAVMPDFAANFSTVFSRVGVVLSTSAQTGS